MGIQMKLFSEFEPVSKEQWKAKANEDLKGKDFEKKLVWKTDEGFSVQPFYTAEDFSENSLLKEQQHFPSMTKRDWTNYTQISVFDAEQANQLASEMVQFGANGILFRLNDAQKVDFSVLLKNLDPGKLHISFSASRPDVVFSTNYFKFLEQIGIKPENIRGFYETDVLDEWTTSGVEPDYDALTEVIKLAQPAINFKTLVIKSHAFVNAGSNTVQELAFTLNKLTDFIDQLSERGLSTSAIIKDLLLHTAIGGNYFFEIAKLRSLRILLKSILNAYNIDAPAEIISSNSVWSKSFYDSNVNILRNTTEAMSALLGGCDALLTYPHDHSFNEPSRFSQRIALNISNLLKEESYFDKVVDPAAGSYYLENLTTSLTEHTLALFKEIEDAGGFIQAFKAGMIQEKIGIVRHKKEKEIAYRKRVYVGTNKYPNLQEIATIKDVNNIPVNEGEIPLLLPQHAARSFEWLRNKTVKHFEATGFIPKVYLASFGNLAIRKARASFAAEFFGSAGFEIMGEFFFNNVQKTAEESAKSEADVVVICSSDQEYELHAAAFAAHFKAISKNKILVLAGYPEKIAEKLKKEGVDVFIHIKSDAIEILSAIQAKLFILSQA